MARTNDHGDEVLFIAFRGSVTTDDWRTNFTFRPGVFGGGLINACVHGGFWDRSNMLPGEHAPLSGFVGQLLLRKTRVVLCGHSAGGALAGVVGARVLAQPAVRSSLPTNGLQVISFGAPLWCNEGLGTSFRRLPRPTVDLRSIMHNYVLATDIVPRALFADFLASSAAGLGSLAGGRWTSMGGGSPKMLQKAQPMLQQMGSAFKEGMRNTYAPVGTWHFVDADDGRWTSLTDIQSITSKAMEAFADVTFTALARGVHEHSVTCYLQNIQALDDVRCAHPPLRAVPVFHARFLRPVLVAEKCSVVVEPASNYSENNAVVVRVTLEGWNLMALKASAELAGRATAGEKLQTPEWIPVQVSQVSTQNVPVPSSVPRRPTADSPVRVYGRMTFEGCSNLSSGWMQLYYRALQSMMDNDNVTESLNITVPESDAMTMMTLETGAWAVKRGFGLFQSWLNS
eukprot:TRINITY_DN68818_c0_g1_i1.p1 TRINITY_DN68818_c0_g1~~TRINITY_DN68818_c0_g1_i1.p1  ORF type:complete len:456 (-),score=60.07 TRINITY_DN68818_c0_g1_i1:432-1799(-)